MHPDHTLLTRTLDRRAGRHAALLGATAATDGGAGARVELRPAVEGDAPVLAELAVRDGVGVPRGPLLVAEAAGVVIAAIGLENRRMVADPAWPTGRAVDALQAAAAEHDPWPARVRRLRAALARLGARGPRRPRVVAEDVRRPAAGRS